MGGFLVCFFLKIEPAAIGEKDKSKDNPKVVDLSKWKKKRCQRTEGQVWGYGNTEFGFGPFSFKVCIRHRIKEAICYMCPSCYTLRRPLH